MKYRSRIDWWMYLLTAFLTAQTLYLIILAAFFDTAIILPAAIMLAVMGIIISPVILNTKYILEEACVHIVCGIIVNQRIPYSRILAVKKSGTLLSSPALSIKRLVIEWRGNNGGIKSVAISPDDRETFISALGALVEKARMEKADRV